MKLTWKDYKINLKNTRASTLQKYGGFLLVAYVKSSWRKVELYKQILWKKCEVQA